MLWQTKFPGGAISHCGSSYTAAGLGYMRAIAEQGWFGLDPAFKKRCVGTGCPQPELDQPLSPGERDKPGNS